MEKTAGMLYQERAKRITDAIQLKVPDRVPIFLNFLYFPAKYAGVTCKDAFYDLETWLQAFRKTIIDIAPDAWGLARNESGRVLEALDYVQMKWPGHGILPNHSHQWIEAEYMKADEYDLFLEDPSDYLIRTYVPRTYKTLEPLKLLPSLSSALFEVPSSTLAMPEFDHLFNTLLRTAREANEWRSRMTAFLEEMRSLGFPTRGDSRVVSPFDVVSSSLRGMRGTMLDMYRQPDKLLALCDWILRTQIRKLESTPKPQTFSLTFIPLHRGSEGFMSHKQFEMFYWPYVKKLVSIIVSLGLTPYVIFEGDYTSRLEYLLELPKGKVACHFDTSDMVRVKEVLGNHVCIMGNVPSSILQTGSKQDVIEYCRKLIDIAGKGGGFILSQRSALDEANPENVKAMMDFAREYGVYR